MIESKIKIGEYLPKEVSVPLVRNLSADDLRDIAKENGTTYNTLNSVIRMKYPLSKDTIKCMTPLLKRSYDNSKESVKLKSADRTLLDKILNKKATA